MDLYAAIKTGNYVLNSDEETKQKYTQIFKETQQRSRAISLRLQENDYIGIKAKAMALGMP